MRPHALLEELSWRGLAHQHTDGLGAALRAGVVTAYCGFDPSAPSLHVGSLVPVMGLVHLQRHGHRPVALVGGGTGLIGDPSGKSQERQLLEPAVVERNARGIRGQLERFLDFDGPTGALMRNNADWLAQLRAVDFIRDVGKHFTVNYMLQKESVKGRMEGGISYTEFSYMLLQAYDFLELHRRDGATLQVGGSDQWGNITAGIKLIRRTTGAAAHALTFPLIATAAGTKFGKTEAGAVWLDPGRSSPYQFYQFWLNTDDRDVGQYLRFFTLLSREEIEALERAAGEHPERRDAQRALARDVTERVHGAEGLRAAEEVSAFMFGEGDPRALSPSALAILQAEAPFAELRLADIRGADADGAAQIDVLKLAVGAKVAASISAARRLLEQGGLSINKRRLAPTERYISVDDGLIQGGYIVVGKGRRDYALARVVRG
ncbi:MAG: tyrosine--tRNA ligase [Gemmatimonadota bacterium]|nr:tyrosine--tRNA ligase [Gemmatimonadota bacterium]